MSDKQTGDIQEKIRGILNTCKYLEQYQIGDVDDAYTVTDHIFDDTKAIKNLSTMLSQELKERDEEWNKYTDMHDDAMLDQINELEDRLKEMKNDSE